MIKKVMELIITTIPMLLGLAVLELSDLSGHDKVYWAIVIVGVAITMQIGPERREDE